MYTITVRLRDGNRKSLHKRWNYYNSIKEIETCGYRTEKGGTWEEKVVGPELSAYQGPAPFAVVWVSKKNNIETHLYKEFTFTNIKLGQWETIRDKKENEYYKLKWYRDTITEFTSIPQDSITTSSDIHAPLMVEFLQGPFNRDPHAPGWTHPHARFIPMNTSVEEGYAITHTQGIYIRYIKKIDLPSGQISAEQ